MGTAALGCPPSAARRVSGNEPGGPTENRPAVHGRVRECGEGRAVGTIQPAVSDSCSTAVRRPSETRLLSLRSNPRWKRRAIFKRPSETNCRALFCKSLKLRLSC